MNEMTKEFITSADIAITISVFEDNYMKRKQFLALLLLAIGHSAFANTDLEHVQSYCHRTALPLMEAAAAAVGKDTGKNFNELSITLAQKVLNTDIYKQAKPQVQEAMRYSLGNEVLLKEKKDQFVALYMNQGENFLSALSALWAQYSVEPYIVKCGYMRFSE